MKIKNTLNDQTEVAKMFGTDSCIVDVDHLSIESISKHSHIEGNLHFISIHSEFVDKQMNKIDQNRCQ